MNFKIVTTLLFLLGVGSMELNGQNDCITATPLCTDGQIIFNPQGAGNVNDLNPSNAGCLETFENNSAWYYFEINDQTPPGSELGFTIDPDAACYRCF